jgi:hypothetical protein
MAKKTTEPTMYGTKKEIKELPWNTQEYRDAQYSLRQPVSEHRTSSARQQDAMRTVGEAEAARTRRIVETAPAAKQGLSESDPYIQKLLKKNPDQEFSVFDKTTGKWVKFNKGMNAGVERPVTPVVTPTPTPVPTTPIVSRPPPGAVVPVAGVQSFAGLPAVSPNMPVVPGVPQAVVRQSSVAPVPYTPVNRVMAAVPQVTPKAVSAERMNGMGQRPQMGRDFSARSGSSYSKNPTAGKNGLFEFD